ncbi:hypothetical protein [Microbacterium dauci]|uniref:Cell division protein FtsL n=1 Tax=Microbacterium dauci TaxID=3048008 RepID=A0ABT6ZHB3_9MICO|nr:hypothetical protein [Microbacterium sp. LX3-4]MDJ1115140.1 hypothetical protein [Microbacterium sp. LX3-4]
MSIQAQTAVVDVRPIERVGHRLRVLAEARPRRRPRLVFGIVAVAGAVAIGGIQMGLSILTTQGAYEVRELTSQQRSMTWEKQILQEEIAGLSSPQFLAANAAALGLVAGGAPNYLQLSDGKTLGSGAGASDRSSIEALKRAAVGNALVSGVPLVTDPEASIASGVSVDEQLLLNTPTPPAITDGLPTPTTH